MKNQGAGWKEEGGAVGGGRRQDGQTSERAGGGGRRVWNSLILHIEVTEANHSFNKCGNSPGLHTSVAPPNLNEREFRDLYPYICHAAGRALKCKKNDKVKIGPRAM